MLGHGESFFQDTLATQHSNLPRFQVVTFSDLKSLIMSLLPIVTKNKHTKIILNTKKLCLIQEFYLR